MKNFYKLSVALVASVHIALTLFITVGSVLQFYVGWVRTFYLPTLIASFLPSLIKVYCPLSSLERWLRRKYDPATTYQYFWDFYCGRKISFSQPIVITFFTLLISLAILGRR